MAVGCIDCLCDRVWVLKEQLLPVSYHDVGLIGLVPAPRLSYLSLSNILKIISTYYRHYKSPVSVSKCEVEQPGVGMGHSIEQGGGLLLERSLKHERLRLLGVQRITSQSSISILVKWCEP